MRTFTSATFFGRTMSAVISLVTIATGFAGALAATAQDHPSSGRATYEHVINMHKMLGPSQQAMKALVPKERTSLIELHFRDAAYRLQVRADEGGNVRLSSLENNAATLVDNVTKAQTRLGEMAGLAYQLETPLPALEDVSFQPEIDVFAGFPAKRLTARMRVNGKTRPVEIWYNDEMPTAFSPFPLKGVPGAVLSMTVGQDFWRYSLKEINFEEVADDIFAIPATYRLITQDQLEDLQQEAMDALRAGGARVMSSKQ